MPFERTPVECDAHHSMPPNGIWSNVNRYTCTDRTHPLQSGATLLQAPGHTAREPLPPDTEKRLLDKVKATIERLMQTAP